MHYRSNWKGYQHDEKMPWWEYGALRQPWVPYTMYFMDTGMSWVCVNGVTSACQTRHCSTSQGCHQVGYIPALIIRGHWAISWKQRKTIEPSVHVWNMHQMKMVILYIILWNNIVTEVNNVWKQYGMILFMHHKVREGFPMNCFANNQHIEQESHSAITKYDTTLLPKVLFLHLEEGIGFQEPYVGIHNYQAGDCHYYISSYYESRRPPWQPYFMTCQFACDKIPWLFGWPTNWQNWHLSWAWKQRDLEAKRHGRRETQKPRGLLRTPETYEPRDLCDSSETFKLEDLGAKESSRRRTIRHLPGNHIGPNDPLQTKDPT